MITKKQKQANIKETEQFIKKHCKKCNNCGMKEQLTNQQKIEIMNFFRSLDKRLLVDYINTFPLTFLEDVLNKCDKETQERIKNFIGVVL